MGVFREKRQLGSIAFYALMYQPAYLFKEKLIRAVTLPSAVCVQLSMHRTLIDKCRM